ncbi:conserved hypothetical protein [Vibrio crassostreae]|nr:conserved hypothetical protein [Vibrio crassostreae]CAK2832745.1 conserved hypothetical protein [Vibrio crassostreae]CAK2837518.1 conserved hypothetical protein [Vibrio crassostreae]CAK2839415.1 conserved hypothetical protein [Vibrio crassostreae]CAK2923953.1 conserved hypothetical protein [Vibrio crassostreae]
MSNQVVDFLTKQAESINCQVFNSIFGEICLDDVKPIKQSSGAVYGILVESETPINKSLKPIPNINNFYPVYWGKDIAPVSRMKAHVQNHQGTGNANLSAITELKGKKIIYGAIMVSDYEKFESHLHASFPPLKGTNRRGRVSQIIEIKN